MGYSSSVRPLRRIGIGVPLSAALKIPEAASRTNSPHSLGKEKEGEDGHSRRRADGSRQ
jgi:hypothetical protein